jgi:hypothetical protein
MLNWISVFINAHTYLKKCGVDYFDDIPNTTNDAYIALPLFIEELPSLMSLNR